MENRWCRKIPYDALALFWHGRERKGLFGDCYGNLLSWKIFIGGALGWSVLATGRDSIPTLQSYMYQFAIKAIKFPLGLSKTKMIPPAMWKKSLAFFFLSLGYNIPLPYDGKSAVIDKGYKQIWMCCAVKSLCCAVKWRFAVSPLVPCFAFTLVFIRTTSLHLQFSKGSKG